MKTNIGVADIRYQPHNYMKCKTNNYIATAKRFWGGTIVEEGVKEALEGWGD
jgi:hypothetical protein